MKLITLNSFRTKPLGRRTLGCPSNAGSIIQLTRWSSPCVGVEAHEAATPNPVDTILFKRFMDDVETQIAQRVRKRFFDVGDRINLKPETIKGVVKRLEGALPVWYRRRPERPSV